MISFQKLGTIDLDVVESNPIIFQGKPYLMEYVRCRGEHGPSKTYHGNTLNQPYCRFLNLEDMKSYSAPFGIGYCFGNAWSDGDHIAVTVTDYWGGKGFYILESDDMIHWSEVRPLYLNDNVHCYNSSMCKVGNKYINALEVGPRGGIVDCNNNYNVFAVSEDLKNWEILPDARFPEPGGWLFRHFENWYFFFALLGDYQKGFTTHIFRSRDLINWEASPQNPIFQFDEADRKIHPKASFTAEQLQDIAQALNINMSDIDMCNYNGKLLISYSWGDQSGHEFLALAEAEGSDRDLCFSCFEN